MNKFLAYFHQLACPDPTDAIPTRELRKLIILNKVHLIGVLICVTYGFLFMGLGIYVFMLSSFFNAILSFSVYYLGKKDHLTLTKWMALAVSTSQITFYGIILNVNSGIGLMMFYILTLVFYMFEDYKSIFLSLVILLSACALLSFSDSLGWQYHFLDWNTSLKILPLSILSSFMMVSFILGIIKHDQKQMDHELITNNGTLELNNQLLVESDTINKRLLSVISHDLRSPIASLQGLLELLAEHDMDPKEQVRLFESLNDRTKNIHQLIEDILLWTSQQEKSRTMSAQAINIEKEIENVLSLYSHEIRNKKLSFVKNINESKALVSDKNILAFSVRNVINNAIKYSSEGSTVRIDVYGNEQYTSICIENTGNLPPHLQHSLFHKQVESTSGSMNEKGVGLGMYLCNLYLKSIDSTIELKPANDHTVCIEIRIKNFA